MDLRKLGMYGESNSNLILNKFMLRYKFAIVELL